MTQLDYRSPAPRNVPDRDHHRVPLPRWAKVGYALAIITVLLAINDVITCVSDWVYFHEAIPIMWLTFNLSEHFFLLPGFTWIVAAAGFLAGLYGFFCGEHRHAFIIIAVCLIFGIVSKASAVYRWENITKPGLESWG